MTPIVAPSIDRLVGGDARQPRVYSEPRPVPSAVSPKRDERLLCDVFSGAAITQHLVRNALHAVVLTLVQLPERVWLAAPGSAYEVGVRQPIEYVGHQSAPLRIGDRDRLCRVGRRLPRAFSPSTEDHLSGACLKNRCHHQIDR